MKKLFYFIVFVIVFISCKDSSDNHSIKSGLGEILLKNNVEGSILIFDQKVDSFYSNDFIWANKKFLPASTFKIANSIAALENGIVKSENDTFKWNGQERRLDVWEQDLSFKQAYKYSCVPCYQEIARNIGADKMISTLERISYAKMDIDSSNIDKFWLEGESGLSQFQQIWFLIKLKNKELPLKQNTYSVMEKIMLLEENQNYKVYGKTGWAIRNGNNIGWFVGFLEADSRTYFFATNIKPKESFSMDLFPVIRKEITMQAFKELGVID